MYHGIGTQWATSVLGFAALTLRFISMDLKFESDPGTRKCYRHLRYERRASFIGKKGDQRIINRVKYDFYFLFT